MTETLRLEAAARYAGVRKRTILDLIMIGLLPATWDTTSGGGWRITPEHLDEVLAPPGRIAA